MTFDKIKSDTECECLSNAVIDNENAYVRKLHKETLEEKDFLTHWERNIKGESLECDNICSRKSVSINQFNSETEAQILEKYKTTFHINPKKGAYFLKFKFLKDAGKTKHTPVPAINDTSHYDFYKADDFSFEKIQIIEKVKFA